jgi:uncharacterized membrane protein YqaE (UPF0057 family)
MNRNWIVLVLAIISLASCSVEKRVYQPGYHIEWNHFASKDQFQDVSQGRSEGASQDLPQDLLENLSKNLETGASQDLPQDLSENLSKNLEIDVVQDVAQDATQDVSQGRSEGASQDLSKNLSENLETGASKREKMVQLIQSVVPVQINSAMAESQLGQKIDSDLALILFILLALFLPALTVFLLEGFSKNFWIALLLMICAFSISLLPFVVRVILEAIAVIMAIAVVLNNA